MANLTDIKFNFLKSTLIFALVGLFIPGFTAIGLLGLQMLLSSFGVDCETAWTVIGSFTIFGAIILPIVFIGHIRIINRDKRKSLKTKLILFNLFEYIFIQAGLATLFTNGHTLCYVGDGQNGLEFAFTAWLSVPILILLSYMFGKLSRYEK